MTNLFNLKWLLIPVLPTVGVVAWSLSRLTGDRNGRLAGLLRRKRVEVWD